MLEINRTTGVRWVLFSTGYLNTHVTYLVSIIDLPIQRLDEYAIVRFSDPTDHRLGKYILSILWERKTLPTSTISCFSMLITSEVS